MIKDIQQTEIPLNKGIVRTPSVGSDGELSECVGLIPHAGELRVIDNPAPTSVELPEGAVLVFVDRVSGGDNYIYSIEGKLGYIRVKDSQIGDETEIDTSALESTKKLPIYSDKYAISSVGNSLIVTGPRFGYVLWKDNGYKALGSSLPQVRLKMGLTRELARYIISGNPLTIEKGANVAASYHNLLDTARFTFNSIGDYAESTKTLIKGKSYRIEAFYQLEKHPILQFTLTDKNDNFIANSKGSPLVLTTPVLGQDYAGFRLYVSAQKADGRDFAFNVYESSTSGEGVHLKRDQETLTSLNGLFNSFVRKMHKEKKFVYPFFVRYAFRMYDGSVGSPSEPCLMVPNSGPTPRIYFNGSPTESKPVDIQREAFAVASSMFFDLDSENAKKIAALKKDWQGIIKGLVFYVSSPVYTYDQSVTAEEEESRLPSVITPGTDRNYTYTAGEEWGTHVDERFNVAEFGWDKAKWFKYALLPPTFSPEYLSEQYRSKGVFYQVGEIDIEDIDTESSGGYYPRHAVSIENSLESEVLLTQPVLEERYFADSVMAGKSFAYNNRSILYNIVKEQNPSGNYNPIYQNGTPNKGLELEAFVTINTPEGEKTINAGTTDCYPFFWLYWPDSRATKVVLRGMKGTESDKWTYTFNLQQHDFLPGKYWFADMMGSDDLKKENATRPDFVVSELPFDILPNKVFTSEVDNPFLFRETAVRTLPSNIVGLATAAKALSEGQFGQFPVYAFCEDGIWAMTVTNEGYLSPAQSIARDIVTNPDSITQLDGAVAFVTSQGLMQIEGSNITPLSLGMEGRNLDESFIGEAIRKFFGKNYVADTGLFSEQVQNCKVLYDYSNQLLHLFGEGTRHYVYSRRDGQWAAQMLPVKAEAVVPGYPLSTLQLGNKLYQYTKHTPAPLQEGFALTRSLTLGNPLSRKMIADIRTIGLKTSSDTIRRIAIFGSYDNQNWFPVKSLKSGSAKYYRFLVMAKMIDTDTLTGIVCRYQERYGHKLR